MDDAVGPVEIYGTLEKLGHFHMLRQISSIIHHQPTTNYTTFKVDGMAVAASSLGLTKLRFIRLGNCAICEKLTSPIVSYFRMG